MQTSYCENGCCAGNSYYYYVCCQDDKDNTSNTGLVVGGVLASIGGVFIIVALAGVICCCCSAVKGRGPSARVVHPYPSTSHYDGATVQIFYTGSSALQACHQQGVPRAQPLQPPPYKREPDPDPGPPSYSSLGRHPSLTPIAGSGSGARGAVTANATVAGVTSAIGPTAPSTTAASGLPAVDDPPFPAEDERVISPPPPYEALTAPQNTRYPH